MLVLQAAFDARPMPVLRARRGVKMAHRAKVNAKALRLAREIASDPITRAKIKSALEAEGKPGMAALIDEVMRFRYVLKDTNGVHWDFETRDYAHRSFQDCVRYVEGKLNGSFSSGEIVSIRRVFANGDKFKPIPQSHRPREIGASGISATPLPEGNP